MAGQAGREATGDIHVWMTDQRECLCREVDRQLDRSQGDGSIEPGRRTEAEGDEAREGGTRRRRKRVRSMGVQLQKSRGSQTQTEKQREAGPEGVSKRIRGRPAGRWGRGQGAGARSQQPEALIEQEGPREKRRPHGGETRAREQAVRSRGLLPSPGGRFLGSSCSPGPASPPAGPGVPGGRAGSRSQEPPGGDRPVTGEGEPWRGRAWTDCPWPLTHTNPGGPSWPRRENWGPGRRRGPQPSLLGFFFHPPSLFFITQHREVVRRQPLTSVPGTVRWVDGGVLSPRLTARKNVVKR